MSVLFISDIHLSTERADVLRAFLDFLSERAVKANSLYILGDLFEAWVGDDDPSELARQVKRSLRDLSNNDVNVFIQHGNRDFTIGKRFIDDIKGTLISDEHTVTFENQSTLVMHGDSLCTDDIVYQRFRRKSRNRLYRWCLTNLPLAVRERIAHKWRSKSALANSNKASEIMDVNIDAVGAVMTKHNATTLIHGHTHRPKVHSLDGYTRIVLGDWETSGSYVVLNKDGFELKTFSIGAN